MQSVGKRKREITSYNAWRGLCAIGIFCHHMSFLADSINPIWRGLYDFFLKYGSRCTSFFFVMSGFFLAYSWKDASFGHYIKGKLKRIYPLAVIVLILAIGSSFISNESVNGNMAIGSPSWIGSIILNLLLLKAFVPVEDVYYSFHGPSWYLSVLFVFYIVGYFVVKKLHHQSKDNPEEYKKSLLKMGGGYLHSLSHSTCVMLGG